VFDGSLLIKRLTGYESLKLPKYYSKFAAGMDLYANLLKEHREKGISIPINGRAIITTGISVELPCDCEGQIRSRSGLAAKNGIVVLNSPGTIDADYRGHLKVILANFGDQDFLVQQGTRIAQLVISPVLRPKIKEVQDLSFSARGVKGFGSTGLS
jgi:dUTP pyrophosphatase